MIEFKNGGRLVQSLSELPLGAVGCEVLYLDHETTSGNDKEHGDNPWGGHRSCGISVTWDDHPYSYYVPVRHHHAHWNLPLDNVLTWHKDVIERHTVAWCNHNVKFDAHFSKADGATFRGELWDTLNRAKLVDSDRGFGRGGYGLDALSSDWLDEDIDLHDQRVQAYLKDVKSKDYARVPADIMAEYSCQDVLTARRLNDHCVKKMSDGERRIWDIETKLTPVLWDIEDEGMRVDPQQLMLEEFRCVTELSLMQQWFHEQLGYPMEPNNSKDCYEVIVNRLGLPVLSWQDEKDEAKDHTPCFDKDALKLYLNHPDVVESPRLTQLFERFLHYRRRHTGYSLFLQPFKKFQRDGLMHSQYNQLIRTGRMSAKRPNSQQFDTFAKELIHPDPGCALLETDASQVEFRLIVHYINDAAVIDAYLKNPDTDFHTWVANMCKMDRRPAKNVNFAIGYGGGKKRVMEMLSADMTVMGDIKRVVDEMVDGGKLDRSRRKEAFEALAQERANNVYRQYHDTLPGIRRVTNKAALLCKETGYVFNAYGRRRHLPEKAAWRAFNSITQGLASDIIKGGMVKLSPRYCDFTKSRGITLKANVHDSVLWHGEAEMMRQPEVIKHLLTEMETPLVPLRVPLRFGCGWSDKSWAAAGKDDAKLAVERPMVMLDAA